MIDLHDITISYDDVCLVPSYSDLESRSEAKVDNEGYSSVIINSPMIHTSSQRMIQYLVDNNMCTTIHRYFESAHEQINHVTSSIGVGPHKKVFFSVGKSQQWIDILMDNGVEKFLVDMAHGDSKVCVDTVKYIRSKLPNATIMAGNVATGEGYTRLVDASVDYIRVGIAGGCFTGDTPIDTPNGTIKISEVKRGDLIKTHTGNIRTVIETTSWIVDEEIIKINGISSTKNHEYYVLDKKYKDIVHDENIHEYASWIPASELCDKFLLISHK